MTLIRLGRQVTLLSRGGGVQGGGGERCVIRRNNGRFVHRHRKIARSKEMITLLIIQEVPGLVQR